MPISFQPVDHERAIEWRQSFTSPSIFLDVWAIQEISTSECLREQLQEAIREKNGTILLTHEVIVELAVADDPRHAIAADALVASVLPNIYFGLVDERLLSGINVINGRSTFIPPPASGLLDALARRGDIPLESRLSEIFLGAHRARHELRSSSKDVAKRLSDGIYSLSEDSDFKKESRLNDLADSRTFEFKLLGEIIRETVLNSEKISKNDVNDMIHTLFSVCYCDIALLDKKWVGVVEKIRRRMEGKISMNIKIPKVFSRKENGIENFMSALRDFRLHE